MRIEELTIIGSFTPTLAGMPDRQHVVRWVNDRGTVSPVSNARRRASPCARYVQRFSAHNRPRQFFHPPTGAIPSNNR